MKLMNWVRKRLCSVSGLYFSDFKEFHEITAGKDPVKSVHLLSFSLFTKLDYKERYKTQNPDVREQNEMSAFFDRPKKMIEPGDPCHVFFSALPLSMSYQKL